MKSVSAIPEGLEIMAIRSAIILLPHNPGDVVMGLPVLTRLKEVYPQISIDYIVGEESAILLENHPHIRTLFTIPASSIREARSASDIREMLVLTQGFLKQISKTEYDVSINFFQDKFGALLHSAIQSRSKIGYHFENDSHFAIAHRVMRHLFAIPVNRSQNPWHVTDIFLRTLNIQSDQRPEGCLPPIPTWAYTHLPFRRRIIALQTGTAWPGKKWPEANWICLGEKLLDKGYALILTGAKEERARCASIENKLANAPNTPLLNLAGQTNLLQCFDVIQQASWLITGDTVAMHLGAMSKTKTVALFGASNPIETGPYGSGHFIFQNNTAVPEELPLSSPNQALNAIKPDDVARLILHGEWPKSTSVWTTRWHTQLGIQVLQNAQLHGHPFQKCCHTLPTERGSNANDGKTFQSPSILNELKNSLAICLESPTAIHLKQLEALESKWAKETHHSVIWEAYRIHINGLDISHLPKYLEHRQKILLEAEQEMLQHRKDPSSLFEFVTD